MHIYKIKLDSGEKIDNFVKILKANNIEGELQDLEKSPHYITKGTVLGALSALEWEQVWFKCEQDTLSFIKDFVID